MSESVESLQLIKRVVVVAHPAYETAIRGNLETEFRNAGVDFAAKKIIELRLRDDPGEPSPAHVSILYSRTATSDDVSSLTKVIGKAAGALKMDIYEEPNPALAEDILTGITVDPFDDKNSLVEKIRTAIGIEPNPRYSDSVRKIPAALLCSTPAGR